MRMVAHVMRPLCCVRTALQDHLNFFTFTTRSSGPNHSPQKRKKKNQLPYSTPYSPLDFHSRGLKLIHTPTLLPSDLLLQQQQQQQKQEQQQESVVEDKKSRNQLKREARKAVQWGMDLASFTVPQIKFIIRVASLEQEVFDAIMVVKRLGSDVRQGKRRQFNYVGRLLHEAQPELMDDLIQASKDGDQSKLQELSGTGVRIIEEDEEEETECEDEEEGNITAVASRWFDGLVDKDSDITNEVYSIHSVEFDRQDVKLINSNAQRDSSQIEAALELRKLVRRVHTIQLQQLTEENEAAMSGAKKSLVRFLRFLAKQTECD